MPMFGGQFIVETDAEILDKLDEILKRIRKEGGDVPFGFELTAQDEETIQVVVIGPCDMHTGSSLRNVLREMMNTPS